MAWIRVTVHPDARKDVLVLTGPGRFEAWVRAKPVGGAANAALLQLLRQHLKLKAGQLRLRSGWAGRRKLFQVLG